MAAKSSNTLLYVGAGAVALYLLSGSSAAAPILNSATSAAQTAVNALTNAAGTALPATVPTNYGVNSGIRGGNGSFDLVSNYAQLLAADPNLGNPNYVMTAQENAQYLANYLDLQQGLPGWVNHKAVTGDTPSTLMQAAQDHWKYYGCAEKRIFLPIEPPSGAAFIPPPVNPKSSGGSSSWIGPAISVAGSIAVALLGTDTDAAPVLSNAEVNVLVTGSAIIKNILPFYLEVAPTLVNSINNKVDNLLSQYSN